jgi:penicillin-binding protein 1C
MAQQQRRRLVVGLGIVGLLGSFVLGGLVLGNWLVPLPSGAFQGSFSPVYYDRHGQLLGARLSPDEKWRFASRLEDVSPYLVTALLEFEDKRFYQHAGIDLYALARAVWQNLTHGRVVSGASTITMQVARLLSPSRRYGTLTGKLVQMWRALQLEWQLSKQEILELYFNLAPYGKNIEGVTAASWLYFRKPPATLQWTEALALAITPKSPNAYRPDRFPGVAQQHCQHLAEQLRQRGKISEADWWFIDCTRPPGQLRALPRAAPHLLARLHSDAGRNSRLVLQGATTAPAHGYAVRTTIDLDVQRRVEQTVTGYLRDLRGQGIRHAAVLVIENASGEVLAYVGSPDFDDKANAGEVDGIRARRSPGSTLKPFLYARALETGNYTPQTLLANVPMRYPGYHPQNFTPSELGVTHFAEALQRSLNLPAVALNAALGKTHDLLSLLWDAGVSTLPYSREQYQSLVLGGGEMRLDELTTLYAALARGGTLVPTRLVQTPLPPAATQPLLTPEASFIISEILRHTPVPGYAARAGVFRDVPDVAWKTGTSSRRRDAWTVGYNPRYTVGVWVGNFASDPVEHMTGQSAAAPLFFRVFRQLPGSEASPWPAPPERVIEMRVCALSGHLPTTHCPAQTRTWWIAGVTKPEFCQMHVQLLIDRVSGRRLSEPCLRQRGLPAARIWRKPGILWPREAGWWLARMEGAEIFPPYDEGCAPETARHGLPPLLQTPLDGEHYVVQRGPAPHLPLPRFDKIVFSVAVSNEVNRLDWFLNGKKMITTKPGETYPWHPEPGQYELVIVDDLGRTARAHFTVHEETP